MRRPLTRRTILRNITKTLIDAQNEEKDPDNGVGHGFVLGLRVAYLIAGGESDGSEKGWANVQPLPRRIPRKRRTADDRRI